MATNNNEPFVNQFMDSVGPNYNIPGQHDWRLKMDSDQVHNPALFGENQFNNGFGPVYAAPTFPWSPIPGNSQHAAFNQPPQHSGSGMANMQHMPGGQWQPYCCLPQVMTTYCLYPIYACPSIGHHHYQ